MRTLMGTKRDKIKYWKNNLFFIHNAIPSSMLHFQFIHIYNNKSNLPKVMKAKNEYQIWMLISGLYKNIKRLNVKVKFWMNGFEIW